MAIVTATHAQHVWPEQDARYVTNTLNPAVAPDAQNLVRRTTRATQLLHVGREVRHDNDGDQEQGPGDPTDCAMMCD